MKNELVKKVLEVKYHRNGVFGRGFHAVLFTVAAGPKAAKFYAVLTDTECYVTCVDLLSTVGVGDDNKWRGADFEPELRRHIKD